MEENFSQMKKLVGFYDYKPAEKTPEEVEKERQEYHDFLMGTLQHIGEKAEEKKL